MISFLLPYSLLIYHRLKKMFSRYGFSRRIFLIWDWFRLSKEFYRKFLGMERNGGDVTLAHKKQAGKLGNSISISNNFARCRKLSFIVKKTWQNLGVIAEWRLFKRSGTKLWTSWYDCFPRNTFKNTSTKLASWQRCQSIPKLSKYKWNEIIPYLTTQISFFSASWHEFMQQQQQKKTFLRSHPSICVYISSQQSQNERENKIDISQPSSKCPFDKKKWMGRADEANLGNIMCWESSCTVREQTNNVTIIGLSYHRSETIEDFKPTSNPSLPGANICNLLRQCW